MASKLRLADIHKTETIDRNPSSGACDRSTATPSARENNPATTTGSATLLRQSAPDDLLVANP